MDGLTFFAQIVDSLAWPLAVVVILFRLKEPLVKLLLNLKHFKYKDAEFDFEKAIGEVGRLPSEQVPINERQLKLAELSPRGAILEAWLEMEEAIGNAAERDGISRVRAGGLQGGLFPVDSWTLAQTLMVSGKLSSTSFERLQKLRQIRNKAVHATDDVISQDDAETFIRLVAELKLETKSG